MGVWWLAAARTTLALTALLAGVLAPSAPAGAEDLGIDDPRIATALVLLDSSVATHELRGVLAANRVAIRFVPMAAGMYARYSVARHVIEIDQQWKTADLVTLAAVIAHEATHAQDAVNGYLSSGNAAACVDSEVRAFRTSALFWVDWYGSAGKHPTVDELDRQFNAIADREVHDPASLENLVRQTYQEQCSH